MASLEAKVDQVLQRSNQDSIKVRDHTLVAPWQHPPPPPPPPQPPTSNPKPQTQTQTSLSLSPTPLPTPLPLSNLLPPHAGLSRYDAGRSNTQGVEEFDNQEQLTDKRVPLQDVFKGLGSPVLTPEFNPQELCKSVAPPLLELDEQPVTTRVEMAEEVVRHAIESTKRQALPSIESTEAEAPQQKYAEPSSGWASVAAGAHSSPSCHPSQTYSCHPPLTRHQRLPLRRTQPWRSSLASGWYTAARCTGAVPR